MLEYCVATLQNAASEPLGLLFALLLGIVSAATSACCTLPALGVLIGYFGAREESNRRAAVSSVVFFTVGTILSLMIIGGIAGYVGQAAQTSLGRYWKVFAGIVAIVFGLATLKLLPFNLSLGGSDKAISRSRSLGPAAAGLLMGGGVAASSLPCNPGIFIVLGDFARPDYLGDTSFGVICHRLQSPFGRCSPRRFTRQNSPDDKECQHRNSLGFRLYPRACGILFAGDFLSLLNHYRPFNRASVDGWNGRRFFLCPRRNWSGFGSSRGIVEEVVYLKDERR